MFKSHWPNYPIVDSTTPCAQLTNHVFSKKLCLIPQRNQGSYTYAENQSKAATDDDSSKT